MNGIIKKAALALVVLAFTARAASAQQASPWAVKLFPVKDDTTKERELSHDFGKVAFGAQLMHRFTMTNPYAVPLEISIRTSCGCVAATPKPAILAPKQTGQLEVTMDARKFTGAKTVTVFVTVGPEFTSTAELKISAVSRGDVVFNPGEVNFGTVGQGQSTTQNIDVEYAGALNWQVTGVVANGAPLDIAYEEFYRKQAGNTYRVGYHVKMTLQANAPTGDQKWEVFVKTNDPASPLVPVVVAANVQGAIVLTPSSLNFSNTRVGEEASRRVLIRGNKQFRILGIDGMSDGVSAELPTVANAVQPLMVKYKPTKAGDLRKQLLIKTDLQEAPITLTIEGNAAP